MLKEGGGKKSRLPEPRGEGGRLWFVGKTKRRKSTKQREITEGQSGIRVRKSHQRRKEKNAKHARRFSGKVKKGSATGTSAGNAAKKAENQPGGGDQLYRNSEGETVHGNSRNAQACGKTCQWAGGSSSSRRESR